MALDRNRLEQEAVKFLQKGKIEKAIQRYQALVRDDPRDRRIRQKLAELYIQTGRKKEGEQHLRQLVKSFTRKGQERQAVPLLKQLVKLLPEDAELKEELGDLYIVTGFPDQARGLYDETLEMLERNYPDKAVPVLRKIIKLSPGEMPAQIKLAELYEASNWSEKACLEWQRLAEECRRLGRADDRARFLELALRMRPDTLSVMQDAAEARLALGQAQEALAHLQLAYETESGDVRTLELLARAFSELGQGDKARPVWLAAAQIHSDTGDAIGRAEALKAALALGDDPRLRAELGEADSEAERFRLRLTDRPWAKAASNDEERVLVRADVQRRYGFPERARETLEGATGSLKLRLSVRVALAELMASMGEEAEAAEILAALDAPDASAAEEIELRLSVLEGREAGQPGAVGEPGDALIDDDLEDDLDDDLLDDMGDDLIDDMDDEIDDMDDVTDPGRAPPAADDGPDHEAAGDAAFASGDYDAALAAYRKALVGDPTDEGLMMKLGEVMAARAAPPAPPPAPSPAPSFGGEPDFSGVFSGGGPSVEVDDEGDAFSFLDEPSAPPAGPSAPLGAPSTVGVGGADLSDAQALLAVCAFDRVEAAGAAAGSLGGQVLVAQARRARGDLAAAVAYLRAAVGEAAETDPDYLPAILELAALNAATGKTRAAGRLLDEIEDIDEGFAPDAVARVRRGVTLLQGG